MHLSQFQDGNGNNDFGEINSQEQQAGNNFDSNGKFCDIFAIFSRSPGRQVSPLSFIPAESWFEYDSNLGNEDSAQSFSDRSFWKPLRVVDGCAFGSWISAPKCLFFGGPGYPRMTLGCPQDVRPKNFLFGLISNHFSFLKILTHFCVRFLRKFLLFPVW